MGTVAPQSSRRLTPLQIGLLIGAGILVMLLIVMLARGGGSAQEQELGSVELTETPFLALAVLSFFAGVLGFVSPCTLPLLPAYFAVTFQSERRRMLVMTLAFMAGLATTFALFGALAGILGQMLGTFGLSKFQLSKIGGLVIIFFGVLSLLGRGFTGFRAGSRQSASTWGSFVFGATFGLGWTSCTGPVLAAILTLATDANPGFLQGQLGQLAPIMGSMLLLVIFAMGLGVPLVLVSTFFGRADRNSFLWRVMRGKGWEITVLGKTLYLHSTSIISGLIFIALGLLMVSGRLALLNNLMPDDLALRITELFAGIEDWLINLLG